MGTNSDRIELLRLFVRIADAGSLSAAGRLIGLSQPSTSRQLRQLEAVLGVQLVKRSTSDMALTEAGKRFLQSAVELVANWDAAFEAVRLGDEELRGGIRVAAPVALGQTVLARAAARFLLRHPRVSIDWRLVDEPGDLAAGGFDLWIRAGPIRDQSLIVKDLWRIERTIVATPGHPCVRHPVDLEGQPAVQLVTYVPLQVTLEAAEGEKATLRLAPSFTTDNIYAAVMAVREGVGYGVLPYWAVQEELDSGLLVEVCPGWHPPVVVLSVAYPQARFRPTRVRLFLDHLRHELPLAGAGIVTSGQGRP